LKYITIVKLTKVIQRVLVRDILYSKLNKAYRLAFIPIFNIRVVIACFPTLAPINVVNKF
jgi:hypothetical protein